MNKLKEKFKKLNLEFENNRSRFADKIKEWLKNGDNSLYKKGSNAYKNLEELSTELKGIFSSETLNISLSKKEISKKIDLFRKNYSILNEISKPVWRQWVEAILVAGTLVFVLRTYVFGLYHVPTGSAEVNILVGDRIFGNKMAYYFSDIKRGDNVIFDNPEFIYDSSNKLVYWWQKYVGVPFLGLPSGPDNWVKRVIAVPGDTIEGRIEDGKTVIYRNGVKLDEHSYVNQYPLIGLRKKIGFISPDSAFGALLLPDFLTLKIKNVFYSYDPNYSLDEQPFYNRKARE